MTYIIKIVVYLLRELVFDNKEEYDFKSAKFNIRKVLVLILIVLSFALNGWLLHRFINVAVQLTDCRATTSRDPSDFQYSHGDGLRPPSKKVYD